MTLKNRRSRGGEGGHAPQKQL